MDVSKILLDVLANSVDQGPVVQSVLSLTSSLRIISLTVLTDSVYNIMIFFAEKMWVAFARKSYSHFFSKKFQHICVSLNVYFNESLTNDIVSFEQLGPDHDKKHLGVLCGVDSDANLGLWGPWFESHWGRIRLMTVWCLIAMKLFIIILQSPWYD